MPKIKYIFLIPLIVLFSSCSNDEDISDSDYLSGSSLVDRILVVMGTRNGEDTGNSQTSDDGQNIPDPKMIEVPFSLSFDENSVIFISQLAQNHPAFKSQDEIFSFRYKENPLANWDEGYNFTPNSLDNPLEWFKIGLAGSYRGGFQLYALYFPGRDYVNQKIVDEDQIFYSVEEDQSNLDNLIKSDILGAYHSTAQLFTRLRFKMYHLMTYLRIRLFVPVYDDKSKTGYYNDALISANLENVSPDFAIEWDASISTETIPMVSGGNEQRKITMYQHPLKDGSSREPIEIPYEQYIPKGYFDQPIEGGMDKVRVYDFSVLIPVQKDFIDENGKITEFSKTDFLNFILRSNSGAENKYIFNQSFTAGNDDDHTNILALVPGNFQYLELYAPRVGNKLIFMNASISPWLHHTSTVNLQDSDKEDKK